MAYNYKKDINSILGLKKDWEKASAAGNVQEADRIAGNAKQYYENLRKNSYGQVADNLSSSNASAAEKYAQDFFGTTGRQAIRPYLYGKGKQYGFSKSDIDNKLSYDERTGEVSFDGINLGKPAYETDGTSYWDAGSLDKAWENAASKNGYTKSDDVLYRQGINSTQDMIKKNWGMNADNEKNLYKKYDRLEDYAYDTNPYETEIGKSIMQGFEWKGGKASDNAAASGASSNSGNIDSYAAANAARQQLVFTAAGKQAVLEDHNARISNIRGILSDLGVQNQAAAQTRQGDVSQFLQANQQVFDNDQTRMNNAQARKNSETERLALQSDVTGYIPKDMSYDDNIYFKDGALINNGEGIDFKAIIDNQRAIIDNPESSETAKRNAQKTLRDAMQARAYKIINNPAYAEWASTLESPANEETATMRTAEADRNLEGKKVDSAEKISMGELENQRYQTDKEAEASNYAADKQAESNQYTADTQKYVADKNLEAAYDTNQTEKEIAQFNATGQKPKLTASQAKKAYDDGTRTQDVVDAYNYYYGTDYESDSGIDAELIQSVANQVNGRLGLGFGGLIANGDGSYRVADQKNVSKIISAVSEMNNLSDDQKIAIFNQFGISGNDIENAKNSPYK